MELKICNTCNIEKKLELFALNGKKNKLRKNKCKECCNQYGREKYLVNKEKYKEVRKDWKKNNIIKLRKYSNEWFKKRKQIDPLFKMKCNLRSLMCHSFRYKNFVKKSKILEMLGCDYIFFKAYIESKFTENMSWENIHIDHIKPLFLANTEEEVIKLNHYTNLQPLFAKDNLIKNKKYNYET